MTYSIQAFIAVQGGFPAALPDGAIVLPLGSGMQMIPLGSAMRRRYAIPFLPLTDDGATVLPATLQAFCARLGAHGPLAYIEAELFGGSGMQAHVLMPAPGADADADAMMRVSDDAINRALSWLGVTPVHGKDEFATVGLDKHRETDAWLDETK